MQTEKAPRVKKDKTASPVSTVVDHFTQTETLTSAEKEKVDEFVSISAELAVIKEKLDRHEKLKKELASIANDDYRFPEKKDAAILSGFKGEIEFGPAANAREIKDKNGLLGAIKSKLGYDAMISMVSVSLTEVDNALSSNESGKFIEAVSGRRTLKSARLKK